MAEELEIIEGDFGSIGGNYKGQYELTGSVGNDGVVVGTFGVMLTTDNTVQFLFDIEFPNISTRYLKLENIGLPPEVIPKENIVTPCSMYCYVPSSNTYHVVSGMLTIFSNGNIELQSANHATYDSSTAVSAKITYIRRAYLRGCSYNISSNFY